LIDLKCIRDFFRDTYFQKVQLVLKQKYLSSKDSTSFESRKKQRLNLLLKQYRTAV